MAVKKNLQGKARAKPKGKEADRRKSRQRLLKEMEIVERKPRKVKIPFKWVFYGVIGVFIFVTVILPVFFGSSSQQGQYMDVKMESPPDEPITFQEPIEAEEREQPTDIISAMINMIQDYPFFVFILTIPFVVIFMGFFTRRNRW